MSFSDDLVSPLRVACSLDLAIDRAATDLPAYWRTRDPALVKPLPGRHVTWFTLRPIPSTIFCSTVEGGATPEMRYRLAFQCSVVAIESLEDGMPNAWMPSGMVPDAVLGQMSIVDDRELEHIRRILGLGWIYEIGRVAYQRATEGNTRGGGVIYTLPPTSAAGLRQIEHLLAEQSRIALAAQNSAQHASNTAP